MPYGKPRKGKAKVKTFKDKKTGRKRKVSYGQAGKAKGGGPRVKPGTKKGDSYCARSYGIKKRLPKKKQNDPNTPNNLSRKRWKCRGKKSMK
jgi:hypothetical protein|tara:strand:+ start:232 stop:507 length:276 start_codon:yes stop_codon:yes gene_type:complete